MQKAVIAFLRIDPHETPPIVFHGPFRVWFFQDEAVQKLLLPIPALKEAADRDLRIRQHDQNVLPVRDGFQRFRTDVRVYKDQLSLSCQIGQDAEFQCFTFLRYAVIPRLVFLWRPANKVMPVDLIPCVAQAGKLRRVQSLKQPVVVIFLASDPVILLCQELDHR